MAELKQGNLFREPNSFPKDLFEVDQFETVQYFKEWYDIFDSHVQRHKKDKSLTDTLSKDIAQDILDSGSVDRINDLEKEVQKQLYVEITHGVINHFFIERVNLFKEEGLTRSDIIERLVERKKRMDQIDYRDMSPAFRDKIELAVTIWYIIDEEMANTLESPLYDLDE